MKTIKNKIEELKKEKFILDACCGKRVFWEDKKDKNTIFLDKIKEVKPDIVGNFKKLPFENNKFKLVVFDPPHILQKNENKKLVTHQYYGVLNPETWKNDLKKGFDECFRVLDDYGTLIFKWSDCNRWANSKAKLRDVFKFIKYKPLIIERFKKSENSITYWCVFMKIPNKKKAQKLMDETLKNIIDEIENAQEDSGNLDWISKDQAKQIIQKHGGKE